MGQKKLARRSKVKPFIKVVNYSHLFPTRYAFELEGLKGAVASDTFKEPTQREDAKKNIKKLLEDRYQTGKNKWFFQPLRVSSCELRWLVRLADRVFAVLIGVHLSVSSSFISTCPPHRTKPLYDL